MRVAHRAPIIAAHRSLDSVDKPRALVAVLRRQQLRSRKHVAMERAPIFFQQHQRYDSRFDQQDFTEQKCVDLPARENPDRPGRAQQKSKHV